MRKMDSIQIKQNNKITPWSNVLEKLIADQLVFILN
jgi:hypothetical protein